MQLFSRCMLLIFDLKEFFESSHAGFLLEKNLRGGTKTIDHCFLKTICYCFYHFFYCFLENYRRAKVVLGGALVPPVAESQHIRL